MPEKKMTRKIQHMYMYLIRQRYGMKQTLSFVLNKTIWNKVYLYNKVVLILPFLYAKIINKYIKNKQVSDTIGNLELSSKRIIVFTTTCIKHTICLIDM